MNKVLIVEDEPKIIALLKDYLLAEGYQVEVESDGAAAMAAFLRFHPDVVLLDVMLPGRVGTDICRDIRAQSDAGIVMISAQTEELDRLLGLELGADDYICKPFSPKEVMARINTLLRRLRRGATGDEEQQPALPKISADPEQQILRINNYTIKTTPTEFHLFRILSSAPGHIYSRSQLVDELRKEEHEVGDRAIDSHIKNLRRKLKTALATDELIKSVYGLGYKFER